MNTMTYGLDIAKDVFQLYWVEPLGECFNRRFTRQALLNLLARRAPGRAPSADDATPVHEGVCEVYLSGGAARYPIAMATGMGTWHW